MKQSLTFPKWGWIIIAATLLFYGYKVWSDTRTPDWKLAIENAQIDTETYEAPPAISPTPPTPPKSLRLEDIDFTSYSEGMARFTGLEVGQSRIEAIDNVRLYFAPEAGDNMIQTSQSIFEREDGAVMVFSAAGLPDDSVKAEEIYLIMTGTKGAQTLQAFGSRIKCHRGENTTDWQTTNCP